MTGEWRHLDHTMGQGAGGCLCLALLMDDRTNQPRSGTEVLVLTSLALVPILPWPFVTLLETDRGWGDAILALSDLV